MTNPNKYVIIDRMSARQSFYRLAVKKEKRKRKTGGRGDELGMKFN